MTQQRTGPLRARVASSGSCAARAKKMKKKEVFGSAVVPGDDVDAGVGCDATGPEAIVTKTAGRVCEEPADAGVSAAVSLAVQDRVPNQAEVTEAVEPEEAMLRDEA